MAYKALYRTYRPTTFEEVAGQQHVVKTLRNALATGKIAHAYLFAGPRGTGKTTMAKLLAKALNCEEGIGCQCNECKNCVAINEGSHPDVLELDAASNNGVDEIRELIDKVKYGTILGRYKVYIIDEVHMLSAGAFNALLKTLEEPPEHVIFILATTEPHKILPTILSRCQRYDFSKVQDNDIRERIKVILSTEHVDYDEEAVNLIISLADGGMRDALSILDQVLAYSGDTLNVSDILDIFSLESKDEKLALLASIAEGDTKDVLIRLKKYIEKGTDIKRLTNDLLLILKDILIYRTSDTLEFSEVLKPEDMDYLPKELDRKTVADMIDTLMQTLKDFKNVNDINPLFEVTLLKLCAMHERPRDNYREMSPLRYEEPVRKFPDFEEQQRGKAIAEEKARKAAEEDRLAKEKAQEEAKKEEPAPEELPANINITLSDSIIYINGTETMEGFEIDDPTMVDIMVTGKKEIKKDLLANWKLLKRLMPHPTLGKAATLLIDGHPLVVNNKVLIIEYANNVLVEKVNKKENQKDLQNVLSNTFGKKMFVFAVNRAESVRLQQKYMNLLQLGKLPKASEVVIEYIGE
ncbi:MAG: DNA polymerase III subunit gamma/tau [Bacilli bacterium]|nr:DNA polymerase III subunit gamma/tau [Bacilli bacterium]